MSAPTSGPGAGGHATDRCTVRQRAAAHGRIKVGQVVAARRLESTRSTAIAVPDPERLVHLQFRRYAGCPVCSVHLRSVVRRHEEIAAAGVREVAVFHSSADELRLYDDLPIAVVGDPGRRLYREYGVESSLRAILDPRAWRRAPAGCFIDKPSMSTMRDGVLGLPADFLIAPDGRVLARKYGAHADDQWAVDEILGLARTHRAALVT